MRKGRLPAWTRDRPWRVVADERVVALTWYLKNSPSFFPFLTSFLFWRASSDFWIFLEATTPASPAPPISLSRFSCAADSLIAGAAFLTVFLTPAAAFLGAFSTGAFSTGAFAAAAFLVTAFLGAAFTALLLGVAFFAAIGHLVSDVISRRTISH